MVDIETLGAARESAPVISIAAIKFDLNAGEVDTDNAFYKNISLPDAVSYGKIEKGTWGWWMADERREVFQNILFDKKATTTREALIALNKWVGTGKKQQTPWAQGTDFDFAILDRLTAQLDVTNPFSMFWRRRDVRTFKDTIRNLGVPELDVPRRTGLAHNALSDVIHQIDTMIAYNDAIKALNNKIPDGTKEGEESNAV